MHQAALFFATPTSASLASPRTVSPEPGIPGRRGNGFAAGLRSGAGNTGPNDLSLLADTSLLACTSAPFAIGAHRARSAPQGIAIPTLSIHLARGEPQYRHARSLVERMYSWRGYRVSAGIPPANGVTLLACHDDRPVGTLTVGLDSGADLACSALYPEEIAGLRRRGAKLCEFTRLAVDQGRGSTEILARMFHVAFIYARQLRDATDLVIEVNPRHQAFYQQLLGFDQAGPLRTCPRVDAPAVLLRLPLRRAETQLRRFGARAAILDSVRSLYPYCFSRPEARQIAERLRAAY